jgi:hypothetical protein
VGAGMGWDGWFLLLDAHAYSTVLRGNYMYS